jgi:multiple sugar transport system substrate-binding protein
MRTLIRMATAVALMAAMAACGSTPTSTDKQTTTLRVWIMGDSGKNFTDLTADFTKETGIKVNVDAIPWANVNEKLTTAVASGNGPDVMQVGLSLLATYQSSGALLDLTPYLAANPNLKNENFLDAVSTNKLNPKDKVLSVPWISDTRVLFYRKDILGDSGFTAPPATWQQLHDYAAKLATRGKDKYGYYIPQWDAPLPIQFTWQAGGNVLDPSGKITFDTAEFRKAVDFYASFYRDKLVPTASDFDQAQGFISGATPMLISGPYLAKQIGDQAPELKGKWAVTTLPTQTAGTALFAGSNMGVWHKTANAEAAVKLLNFLAKPATQLKWFQINGELPTVKAAISDPALTADPNVAVYAKQLQDAKLLPVLPAWDKASTKMLETVNAVVLKGADQNATLTKLNDDVAALQK